MPRVSAFYGIVITMYFDETRHQGRAQFHQAGPKVGATASG
jgi:hypothetical protein